MTQILSIKIFKTSNKYSLCLVVDKYLGTPYQSSIPTSATLYLLCFYVCLNTWICLKLYPHELTWINKYLCVCVPFMREAKKTLHEKIIAIFSFNHCFSLSSEIDRLVSIRTWNLTILWLKEILELTNVVIRYKNLFF